MAKKVWYSVLIIAGIAFFAGWGQDNLAPQKNVPAVSAQSATVGSSSQVKNYTDPSYSHKTSTCSDGYYENVDGICVHSPSSNPQGATAKCSDGTYSYSLHRQGTCSHHGGVAEWL